MGSPDAYTKNKTRKTKMRATRKTTKRKAKKTTAKKQPNPAFDFLVKFMKRRPKAIYADAAAAAKRSRLKIYPVMWGRAQLLLGRVKAGKGKLKAKMKAAARKTKATRKKVTKKRVGRPRGPGRPRKSASREGLSVPGASVEELQALVDALNAGGKASLRYDGSEWTVVV
ncbi:MAG: hypothetical protein DWP92_10125 [Armatimonadetes bacterium]|nr:MAG: hypothetical protein DWP92_10125 [Armatimonadota bacterium]